jgi:hypothetical protein
MRLGVLERGSASDHDASHGGRCARCPRRARHQARARIWPDAIPAAAPETQP